MRSYKVPCHDDSVKGKKSFSYVEYPAPYSNSEEQFDLCLVDIQKARENSAIVSNLELLLPALLKKSLAHDKMLSLFAKSFNEQQRTLTLEYHSISPHNIESIEKELREKYSALQRLREHNTKLMGDYQTTLSKYQTAISVSTDIINNANKALHFIRYAHPLYFRHKKFPSHLSKPNMTQLNFVDPYHESTLPDHSPMIQQKRVTFLVDDNQIPASKGKFYSLKEFFTSIFSYYFQLSQLFANLLP